MFSFRRKPLHEQLAEEAELDIGGRPPAPRAFSGFLHNGGLFDAAGIHGVHRQREWDAVATVEAEIPADRVEFVALPDGTLVLEDDVRVPDASLSPLADGVEETLAPPYRALAVQQGALIWAVAAKRIAVRAFPGHDEDEVTPL